MRLPPIKRFLTEDFPSQKEWIDKLFYPLNQFLTSIFEGLNNGITVQDNMLAQLRTVSISGAKPTATWPWPFQTRPIGLIIISAVQTNGTPAPILNAVYADWSFSQGVVSVNNISGLNSSNTYSVTFQVIGG